MQEQAKSLKFEEGEHLALWKHLEKLNLKLESENLSLRLSLEKEKEEINYLINKNRKLEETAEAVSGSIIGIFCRAKKKIKCFLLKYYLLFFNR